MPRGDTDGDATRQSNYPNSSSIVPNISATLNAKVVAQESDQTDPHRISKLYDTMADTFLRQGLNLDAVASQSLYYNGSMPLEYTAFPTPLPDAAVRLCLVFFEKVHQELAEKVERASREIASTLPDTYDMHLTKRSHYHITIFMTSQPHALRPDPFDPSQYELDMATVQDVSCMRPHDAVLEREIQTMKEIVAQHKSPVFRVHRIMLADSGTLLLCLVETSPHASIFHLRKAFRKAFPGSPPKQSTIYHASLGRIVTPEQLTEEKRREIHDMCEYHTRQLQGHEFTVDELFHVREVQFTTVEGPSVSLPLNVS